MTWPTHYSGFPDLEVSAGDYALRPLRWEDREAIRQWRNAQIHVLRQAEPLSAEAQDAYYRDVIAPQMSDPQPSQILVAMTSGGSLIGYGGVVHISWPDRRGEVSFLSDPRRSSDERFTADWRAFLDLLIPLSQDTIGLHKLTTETYEIRTNLVPLLEEHGFVREGTLREHHLHDGQWVTSLAHGLVLSD